jgi:hypothetical protein
MKLSVSLSDDDVEFLDHYATENGVDSRSAVVQRAVALLRVNELAADYTAAWQEWDESEAEIWDAAVGDGVESAGA